jgi:hypothetical protein
VTFIIPGGQNHYFNDAPLNDGNIIADGPINHVDKDIHIHDNNADEDTESTFYYNHAISKDTNQSLETGIIHSFNQKWTVSLLKLKKAMNAPDYAFSSIF